MGETEATILRKKMEKQSWQTQLISAKKYNRHGHAKLTTNQVNNRNKQTEAEDGNEVNNTMKMKRKGE